MFSFILSIYILPCIIGLLWFLNFIKLFQNLMQNKEILVQKVFGSLLSIGLIISMLFSFSNLHLQPYIN